MIHSFMHLELEPLPSGSWGYMHFPITQRYARNLGIDTMGRAGTDVSIKERYNK